MPCLHNFKSLQGWCYRWAKNEKRDKVLSIYEREFFVNFWNTHLPKDGSKSPRMELGITVICSLGLYFSYRLWTVDYSGGCQKNRRITLDVLYGENLCLQLQFKFYKFLLQYKKSPKCSKCQFPLLFWQFLVFRNATAQFILTGENGT